MSKMETAQKIWEASTKVFDKMDSEEKKEWMNSLIDELETNKWIKWLKESWNTMNEEQKLKIYKRHSISLWSYLKYTFMPYRMWEKVYNITKHSLSKWDNHTRKYATLEEIPCRFFVQLWILDKPKEILVPGIIEEELLTSYLNLYVKVPKKGEKLNLVNNACNNAKILLEEKFELIKKDDVYAAFKYWQNQEIKKEEVKWQFMH